MLAGAASAQAGTPISVRPVIEVGDAVPAFGPGVHLLDIGTHPSTEVVFGGPADVPASVDHDGVVTLHGFVGSGALPPPPAPSAWFRVRTDGSIDLIARLGDPGPNGQGVFQSDFLLPPVTPRIRNGRITLGAVVGDNPFNSPAGVFGVNGNGPLETIAFDGDTLPDLNPGGEAQSPSSIGRGVISRFLFSGVRNGPEGELRPEGLWRERDGLIEPIIVVGADAPEFGPGAVFGESAGNILQGTIGAVSIGPSESIALTGLTRGPGITNDNDEGLFFDDGDARSLLAREGDAIPSKYIPLFAPGATFFGGGASQTAFTPLAGPRTNARGDFLFSPWVDIPGDPPRVPTIWRWNRGESAPSLILRGRQRAVAFSVPGDPAPGVPNHHFFAFSEHVPNDRGDIMVRAFVEQNNDLTFELFGVWVDRGNGFESLGYETGPVPGMPGLNFLPRFSNNNRAIREAILFPDGAVAFVGFFRDASQQIVRGLFAMTPDGAGAPLIVTKSFVDVGGDVRQVASFEVGEGITDNGELIVEVRFSSGESGLYLVQVTSGLGACTADLNGDAIVDFADLNLVLGAFGTPDPSGDVNGDGVTDFADLNLVLGSFGQNCP